MVETSGFRGRAQILERLRSSFDADKRLDILREVKNDLIGHESRKLEYIRHGILPDLSEIFMDAWNGKQGSASREIPSQTSIYAEAANIICLIAHEGPEFVYPILESDLPPRLLNRLTASSSQREKLAILRSLNAIANELPPVTSEKWTQDRRLAELLYEQPNIGIFASGIVSAKKSLLSQQICDSTITLMCKTCKYDWQIQRLTENGILRALAQRLATFVVSEGLVIPRVENLNSLQENAEVIPEPAPKHAHMSPVLEAISLLIENSKERAEQFLADPSLAVVLPLPRDDFSPSDIRQAPWGSNYFSGGAVPRSRTQNIFDGLLPSLPATEKSSCPSHLNFPPLGGGSTGPRRRSSFYPRAIQSSSLQITHDIQDDREEDPLIPWLLFVARESRQRRRLLASKLLVVLYSLNLVRKSRSNGFSGLLVPILARMLEDDELGGEGGSQSSTSYLCSGMHYSKAAPAVLALLIKDDQDLQKVAVDGKAIVKLSSGLKRTFDETLGRKAVPWRPCKEIRPHNISASPDSRLGPRGPTHLLRNEMAYREGTLQALAAIAPFNDDYRKQICDQGVLAQIMLALEPFNAHGSAPNEVLGNSVSTILAACGAVRALTRSVTSLRTKLVDAEVAKTIIKLMSNSDPEIRIAATKVLANLAMYLSPMKESVGESAVVKKLCEQAHSANATLRLESIWALKQLVVNASKTLKQEIVDELGSSWIKLLIKTDPYDIPHGEVIGLVDKDYPPRSNLMRTPNPSSDDVVMNEDSEGERSAAGSDLVSRDSIMEFDNFSKRAPEDDLAIQEQVLDMIRNLFCGDNASDLVDYVVGEIGKDDFFKIMLTRLRPRVLSGATRKDNQTTSAPTGIVVKVLYIVVHIAACSHRWRATVAKEQALLKQILTYSTHTDRAIRAQCCWLAINLMYEDEVSDRTSCKQRAIELQKIGYVSHLRRLENDADLDVRERAKTAIHLFTTLMS